MPRLLPLFLALLTLLCWTSPARATERLAVLELTGKALTVDERAILTDTVRGAVVETLGKRVVVMTKENMEVMLSDMGVDATCVSEGACEVETARNLGVDYVVSGSAASMSGTLVVSLKLLETRSGQMVASKQVTGTDALAMMQSLAGPSKELVASLAAPAPRSSPVPVAKAPAAPPPKPTNPVGPLVKVKHKWVSVLDQEANDSSPLTLSRAGLLPLASSVSGDCAQAVKKYRRAQGETVWLGHVLGTTFILAGGFCSLAGIAQFSDGGAPVALGGGVAVGLGILGVTRPNARIQGVVECAAQANRPKNP